MKSLYGVFASKEDLIEAVLALQFGQHVAPLLSQPRQDLPEGARVLAFVDGLLSAMNAERDYLVLVAQGSAGLPAKMRVKGRDP